MKKFFIQDVKEGSQQAAYMFIAINVIFLLGELLKLIMEILIMYFNYFGPSRLCKYSWD
jgi:hypothetical protein